MEEKNRNETSIESMKGEKNLETTDNDSASISPPEINCDICKTSFSGFQPYTQHIKGAKHQKVLQRQLMMEKYKTEASENVRIDVDPGEEESKDVATTSSEIVCELCNKKCSGYIPFEHHLKSSYHAKQMKKRQLEKKLQNIHPESEGEKKSPDEEETVHPLYETLPNLKPYGRCESCDKSFTGPETLNQHLMSNIHQKKILELKMIQKVQEDANKEKNRNFDFLYSSDVSESPSENISGNSHLIPFAKCNVCSKAFSGPVPMQQHILSTVHKKQLEKAELHDKMKDLSLNPDNPGRAKYSCDDCKKLFNDPVPLQQHLISESHEKQKKKNEILKLLLAYPEITRSTGETIEMEMSHNKSGPNGVTPNTVEAKDDSDTDYLVCNVCHKCFTGPESTQDHVLSKRHIRAKEQQIKMKLLQQHSHPNNISAAGKLTSFISRDVKDAALNSAASAEENLEEAASADKDEVVQCNIMKFSSDEDFKKHCESEEHSLKKIQSENLLHPDKSTSSSADHLIGNNSILPNQVIPKNAAENDDEFEMI